VRARRGLALRSETILMVVCVYRMYQQRVIMGVMIAVLSLMMYVSRYLSAPSLRV
jgi:hypothetical protein